LRRSAETPLRQQGFERALSALGKFNSRWLTTVAAIHDMVDRAGIFDAQRVGHGLCLVLHQSCVNAEDRPFCFMILEGL